MVDKSTAEELSRTFVEVVYAPDYDESAITVFQAKKDIRIGKVPGANHDPHPPDIVVLDDGSLVLEDAYSTGIQSLEQLKQLPAATKRSPSETEDKALLHSWMVACKVRSNAVVLWMNDTSLAIGTGEQDRIDAIDLGIEWARKCG